MARICHRQSCGIRNSVEGNSKHPSRFGTRTPIRKILNHYQAESQKQNRIFEQNFHNLGN